MTVRVADEGIITQGQGANTDIVVASVKAYINALNKLRWRKEHPKKVTSQVCKRAAVFTFAGSLSPHLLYTLYT